MVIEQTVEIPVSHRLVIDVPPEVPAGKTRVVIQFPKAIPTEDEAVRPMTAKEAIEYCRGLTKRLGCKVSGDTVLEARREDKALEDAKFRRVYGHGLIENKK
jgi:hypothetical protein